ncbi:acyl-CoA thioesterase [Gloeobacter morelensis]|uniref:Acyl-CoA thioesterase n=1 Tax=Gloeobacter morelensis MG652769 TaxID=2781736 RepID=A0ABY3PRH1_9CYAN|nr:acyl-CoA thioesterase [Gloeobacter morelensis]UFP96311.1 acyl-CoA thioesterase [Gloeobacter morelensis MG652769]
MIAIEPPKAAAAPRGRRAFEYRHTVSFEETNLVGNVYFANHLRWQGRCREMFLREHAPQVLEALNAGLALVTVRVACEYFNEFLAFDQVLIEMRLGHLAQNRVTMLFEYWRLGGGGRELMARGEQQAASMRRAGEKMVAAPFPPQMLEAFRRFSDS